MLTITLADVNLTAPRVLMRIQQLILVFKHAPMVIMVTTKPTDVYNNVRLANSQTICSIFVLRSVPQILFSMEILILIIVHSSVPIQHIVTAIHSPKNVLST
jgi:hypothetical protein